MFNIHYLIVSIQEVFDNCQKLGSKYLVFWFQWELVEKVTSGGEGFSVKYSVSAFIFYIKCLTFVKDKAASI